MSITPPPTPPLGVEGGVDELPEGDGFQGDSEDFLDFILADAGAQPILEQEKNESCSHRKEPDCFCCEGGVQWSAEVGKESFLGRGVLTRLLQRLNPSPTAAQTPPKIVFCLPCTPDNLQLQLSHFFMALRQCVVQLEKGAHSNFSMHHYPGSSSNSATPYPGIREDCTTFLSALTSLVYGLEPGEEVFLGEVMQEVVQTLVFLGPLHQLPHHVIAAASPQGNKCPSASYHLLHLHLDVRWWSLVLLHLAELTLGPLAPQLPPLVQEPRRPCQGDAEGEDGSQSPLQQCMSMVVWDLITLMSGGGSSLKHGVSELHQDPGFSCGCGLELAVMVKHFLDYRHACLAQQSFWEEVKDKLLVMLKIVNEPSSPSSSNPTAIPPGTSTLLYPPPFISTLQLPHVWWIFLIFTKLHTYDSEGRTVTNSVEVKSEVKLLRTLLRLSLGDPRNSSHGNQPTEAELRFFLRCCLGVLEVCNGSHSSEWAAPLWDHMAKQLNSSFLLPGAGLEGLACVSKTIGGWLEQVKSRVNDTAAVGRSETSWQIFLRIVVGVVKSGPLEWRQMRGRIYSKFHGRKMSELTPTGLHNTVSLFLTLAATTDTLDVINKLGELLSLVPAASVSKSRVVWRGLLAGMLLLLERGCDIATLAERLASFVTTACHTHAASRDPQHKRELGQLLILYAEGVQEVIEHSFDLSLSQHTLICSGVGSVLPNAGAAEIKVTLGAMDAVLTKVLNLCAKPETIAAGMVGSAVVEAVWKEYSPFLRSHATTLTPPLALSSLAASLTLCLSQKVLGQAPSNTEAASSLLLYFLTNENVNTGCSLHYASCLLAHPGNLALLSSLYPAYERVLVSCWLCGLVGVGGENEAVEALTPQIVNLPSVADLLLTIPPADPFAVASSFIKGVASTFASKETFTERISYREEMLQCFSGLDKAFGSLLRTSPPPTHLSQALSIAGNLFFYAHSVIYIKSKPTCPMATLLTTILLPTPIYSPEKPLSAAFTTSISTVLPRMVCGIGSLGLAQDSYLMRCMKDIFTHYIHRFPVKATHGHVTTTHPFLATLHHSEARPSVLKELRKVFLDVVRDNYVARRGSSALHLQVTLALLVELLQRNAVDWLEAMCSVLLLPLLELLLTLEEQVTKRLSTDLLQKMLQEAQDRGIPPKDILVGKLQELVGRHMSWSSGQLFRVLRVVAVLHRPLLLEALPHVTRAVVRTEERRGTGLDHTLRQGYNALLLSLGVTEEEATLQMRQVT